MFMDEIKDGKSNSRVDRRSPDMSHSSVYTYTDPGFTGTQPFLEKPTV